jgi:hypothetical protein
VGSVNSIINHAPADWLFYQDDALCRWGLVLERGFENHSLIVAFRRPDEFLQMSRADARARQRASKGRPSRLRVAHKLALRAVHWKILRFLFERFFVIALIEKLEPCEGDAPRGVFIGALFCARGEGRRAANR